MKLGLVARADNSGLGIQTHEFYRHMQPAKTMVVDISKLNGNLTYPQRYKDDSLFVHGLPAPWQIDKFLEGLDVIFVAESPYTYYLYQRARELGVKTAVQYNYEFFDWFVRPDYPKPDMLIAPSRWHFKDVQKWCDENQVKHTYLHCPVNREVLPQRKITKARTFLHVAGRSAAHDRNGTETVIAASRHLKTDAQILIHFQGEQGLPHQATNTVEQYKMQRFNLGDPTKVTIRQEEIKDYQDVYNQGDVLLLPRRYGGNCLPMNEALSVGMPVVMTDISPNSGFLPHNWLVPAIKIAEFEPRTVVDIYASTPEDLAAKIDEFYNLSDDQMWFENIRAGKLAQSISWRSMKPQYEEALASLCS